MIIPLHGIRSFAGSKTCASQVSPQLRRPLARHRHSLICFSKRVMESRVYIGSRLYVLPNRKRP